jgi:hypothetical protein
MSSGETPFVNLARSIIHIQHSVLALVKLIAILCRQNLVGFDRHDGRWAPDFRQFQPKMRPSARMRKTPFGRGPVTSTSNR